MMLEFLEGFAIGFTSVFVVTTISFVLMMLSHKKKKETHAENESDLYELTINGRNGAQFAYATERQMPEKRDIETSAY